MLQHIARGYMYKEIALRLDISPKTVEAHVSSVLRKLQLSSRHEPWARSGGWTVKRARRSGATGLRDGQGGCANSSVAAVTKGPGIHPLIPP